MDIRNLLLDDLEATLANRLQRIYETIGNGPQLARAKADEELSRRAEEFSQRIASYLADIAMAGERHE